MISVVIAALNEEEVLERLVRRINRAADTWQDDFEVIVVDDGSTDLTPVILDDIHERDPRWRVVTLSRNFGHQSAVSAGLAHANGDAVVILDADLQDPPEVVDQLLERWREGFDVVYAVRTRRKEGILKRLCYTGFYRVLSMLSSIPIPLDSGDFCLLDRRVVDVLNALPERSRFLRGLRRWAGFRQIGVAYERDARLAGDSKYSWSKLVRLALDGIFSLSSAPLKLASVLGIGLCSASILLMTAVLGWWTLDVEVFGMRPRGVAGWTSLCCLLLFLSGLQFLVLGIMGEYLARVFDEVKGRPSWVVARLRGFEFAPGAEDHRTSAPSAPLRLGRSAA